MTSDKGRQPWLHDRQIAVYGNATVLSAPDATIGDLGTGLIVDDRLVLGRLRMTLDGEAPRVIAQTSSGALTSVWACARNIGDTSRTRPSRCISVVRSSPVGCRRPSN